METRACSGVDRVFALEWLTRKLLVMAPRRDIEAPCDRQIFAARAVYRERMATSVASIGAAEAAFKDAVLAFADEPSQHNAGRYLAASERLTVISRLGASGASRAPSRAIVLASAS
jgi:hypothetical protein